MALALACHNDRASDWGDGASTTSTTNDSLNATVSTGTDTTGLDSTTAVESSSSSGSGTGGPATSCEFSQCEANCCDKFQQCTYDSCVPECVSGVQCGSDWSTCCASDQVCLATQCVDPGQTCLDSYDCPSGEFCELSIRRCLPVFEPATCDATPTFSEFELSLEWSWEASGTNVAPVVGDVTGDHINDVVVVTRTAATPSDYSGEIVILDGRNGTEALRVPNRPNNNQFGAYMRSTPALGDVDGDGVADIVYAGLPVQGAYAPLHAVTGRGAHLWVSHSADGTQYNIYTRNGAVLATNLDGDSQSEIAYGIALFDSDGLLVADNFNDPVTNIGSGGYGSQNGYGGSLATAADLDGDGHMEIVTGRDAFAIAWNDGGGRTPAIEVTQLWSGGGADGYPAIADLDQDGHPEIVVVAAGTIRIFNGDDGSLWCGRDPTRSACSNESDRTQALTLADDGLGGPIGRGGPPTIADFDGDGRPEIAVAGASAVAIYDVNRPGEDVGQPKGGTPPAPGAIFIRWASPVRDTESAATGSTAFDFSGDGTPELLYQDECYARIYDGRTGTTQFEIENSSPTVHEYPVVVDVDGDGNSELIVVSSTAAADTCADIRGYQARQGVFVYGDPHGRWARTRQVWPQYTYHVTNSESSALSPTVETPNWLTPGLNNFRQGSTDAKGFQAPDLALDLSVRTQSCDEQTAELLVTVRNQGESGVPRGITVTLWSGTDATGREIGTARTSTSLAPGDSEQFIWFATASSDHVQDFFAAVDDAPSDIGSVAECDETNNVATAHTISCSP